MFSKQIFRESIIHVNGTISHLIDVCQHKADSTNVVKDLVAPPKPVDSAPVRLFTPSTPEHRVRRQLFPSATPSPAGSSSQGNGTDASA